MVSGRGFLIGLLIMALGFFVIWTFISPEFLYHVGIGDRAYTEISKQIGFWGPAIGIAIVLAGIIAMGKFE